MSIQEYVILIPASIGETACSFENNEFTLWNFEVASPAFAMIHYRSANLGAAQIPT